MEEEEDQPWVFLLDWDQEWDQDIKAEIETQTETKTEIKIYCDQDQLYSFCCW